MREAEILYMVAIYRISARGMIRHVVNRRMSDLCKTSKKFRFFKFSVVNIRYTNINLVIGSLVPINDIVYSSARSAIW